MATWMRWFGIAGAEDLPYVAPAATGRLTLTYLGTAGFVLSDGQHTVVLDPFITRPSLLTTLTQPLVPNAALIAERIPQANDVLIGHAHHDHLLDAPDLCRQTGARLIGSESTMWVGRAAGLPEAQLRATRGHEDIASGPWTLRGFPSRHGRVFGRVPFPGDLTAPPPWPPRVHHLKHGLVLNWRVETGGLSVMHIDSADFIGEAFDGHSCDVLCLCAIGRQSRPGYVAEAIARLKPRYVIPCHWDTMVTPLDAPPELLPGVDLPGFLAEIRAAGAQPLLTPLMGVQRFA